MVLVTCFVELLKFTEVVFVPLEDMRQDKAALHFLSSEVEKP